jgi:hypothetical protein
LLYIYTSQVKKFLIPVVNFFLVINLVSVPAANAVLSNPTPVCVSGTCTINFETTGDYYLWSAPTTGTYTFQVWGAQGGDALDAGGNIMGTGPLGGYSAGNYSLASGQAVYVYVGGKGSGSRNLGDAISGGFNGGGIGYNGDASNRAASGGGGSDVRIGGNALANRVIVAGAGGGGKKTSVYGTQSGSYGGGTSGAAGLTSSFSAAAGATYNGWGGTQSGGGAGGDNGWVASAGTSGNGGNGISYYHSYGSSGGGGGYFGGGGAGVGMSPGGGSGYVGGVTSSTITAGNATMPNPAGGSMVGRSGNGYIRITYEQVIVNAAFTLFQLAGATTTATFRTSVAISATVTVASKVTFRANGKVIPGCKNRTASGSGSSFTATCPWKPSVRGPVTVLATADPVTDGISNVTSSPISVGVINRTGNR